MFSKWLFLVCCAFFTAGCVAEPVSPIDSASFVHVVLFKAKTGSPDAVAKSLIEDVRSLLTTIPTVKGLWVGRPGASNRPIVDSNYDVGLMILFEDQKGMQTYLDSPQHTQFAKKHDSAQCDVRVFDFAPRG